MPTQIVVPAGTKSLVKSATLRPSGKNLIRVSFDGSDKVYDLPVTEFPKQVRSGEWQVKLSGKGDKLYGVWPINGTFIFEVADFPHREGQPPMTWRDGPRTVTGDDGSTWTVDKQRFSVNLRIVSGMYKGVDAKGLIVPTAFDYRFVDNAGKLGVKGSRRPSRYLEELVRFMEVAGYDFQTDEITFSENMLPDIEALLLKRKARFMATLTKGFVGGYAPPPEVSTRKSR